MNDRSSILGESPPFLDLLDQASRLAPLDRPVLLIGERGTGKELIARRLHYLGPRWEQPFVSINCAALPETLLEAELFGVEPGAFTGAERRRAGRFERADHGTLFLDEVASLSPAAQEKLLRVIEYGTLERLGGAQEIAVDVRLVAAANVDLAALARAGRFRADLLDRLAFDVLTLPPLRARGDDILLLAHHFAIRMARELGWSRFPGFSPRVRAALAAHPWPGNVRELKNVVERAVYRWGDETRAVDRLDLDPFDSPRRPPPPDLPSGAPAPADDRDDRRSEDPAAPIRLPCDLKAHLSAIERGHLLAALEHAQYHQRRAAELLGLGYESFRHLLKKHAISLARRRRSGEDAGASKKRGQ
ncbi:MAG: phage shock protein operon transcriptional activator [Alphaproteobacteria bacterium]|nr:MAG: phage shock protein operon transcriptional activator [Alphaproteobacteria bacterium]